MAGPVNKVMIAPIAKKGPKGIFTPVFCGDRTSTNPPINTPTAQAIKLAKSK